MKNINLPVIRLEMIKEHQCPGCTCGSDPETCYAFSLAGEEGWFNCSGWSPGTYMSGVGNIALGLPTGFNKLGNCMTREHVRSGFFLVMFESQSDIPETRGNMSVFDGWYNKLNVPTWAMEKDGYLYVKVASSRKMEFRIEIIKGGTMDIFKQYPDLNPPINVGEFVDQID